MLYENVYLLYYLNEVYRILFWRNSDYESVDDDHCGRATDEPALLTIASSSNMSRF